MEILSGNSSINDGSEWWVVVEDGQRWWVLNDEWNSPSWVSSNQAAGKASNESMDVSPASHLMTPEGQAHQQNELQSPCWLMILMIKYRVLLPNMFGGPITILYGNPHSYPLYNQAAAWKDMEWQRVLNMAQLVSLCNVKLREVAI